MNFNPKIAILLSTYNGEKFLADQVNSILWQSYSNFVIVIRDDGSTDSTPDLILGFLEAHPDKFHIVPSCGNNLGPSSSFSFLIEYVLENKSKLHLQDAYIMFCDQDDIWLIDKIQKQKDAILSAEYAAEGTVLPVLVHSDLQVVSQKNQPIAESLVNYQGLEIERNGFTNLVISNLVTGCTVMINEALARKATPVSKHAIMHDWWLALAASAFGEIVFLARPLVRYRQHESNAIGAKEFTVPERNPISLWRKLVGIKSSEHLYEVARQAKDFQKRFGSELGFKQNFGLRISACMKARLGIIQRIFYRIARRL